MIAAMLTSQRVLVPFENVAAAKQVSSIVTLGEGRYISFSFVEDENRYLGPVSVRKAEASSGSIASWLDEHSGLYDEVKCTKVDLIKSMFLLDREVVSVIEGFDIWDDGELVMRLRREGATYSYGLVMTSAEQQNPENN
jgi:hypothetical protein